MAVSNNIIAFLNFLSLLCSIPIIAAGIYLSNRPDFACLSLARWPVILLGVLVLLVSLAGFVGAYWSRQGLLAAYLFLMALLIVLFLIFLVFAFVVTKPDGGPQVEGYSSWMKRYVGSEENWGKVRSCLVVDDVCGKMAKEDAYFTADQFFQSHLSPLQSGCCNPPTACGYTYVNPTVWINPTNQAADADCFAWSNNQSQLCYNCNSCKAGTLGNVRKEYRKANVALIVAAVALIFVYVVGCSAYKNAQTEEMFNRYKQGWV